MSAQKPMGDTNNRLPRHTPIGWEPAEILVSRLSCDGAGGLMNFRLTDAAIYPPGDVIQLIRDLHSTAPPTPMGSRPSPISPKIHPLEIWVAKPCYVLILLSRDGPVRFRSGGPAVTAKEDYSDDNCGLKHIHRNFTVLSDRVPGEDCYFAYFAVTQRGPAERQSINLHLELQQDNSRGWLEIAIDPDVPDDGGGVPIE